VNEQLPLFIAAAKSLKWIDVKKVFAAHMPVIQEIDTVSGLPAFMLAASGSTSDIESVYNLLKEYPPAISVTSYRLQNSSTYSMRKRARARKRARKRKRGIYF